MANEQRKKHMLMATDLLHDDPELALRHARAAISQGRRDGAADRRLVPRRKEWHW